MVGLGGLEPPTSPLSGARSSHLSYRPLQNRVANAYNLFSLRCLSVIRNCVQIRALCTRQQFLYHFSLLSVLKVRVVAGGLYSFSDCKSKILRWFALLNVFPLRGLYAGASPLQIILSLRDRAPCVVVRVVVVFHAVVSD